MKILLFSLSLLFTSLGLVLYAEGNTKPPQPKVIILLGAPGSGKGTQAARLSQELGIPHISTGDLFRENLSKSTELGKRAKTFMDAGHLVPDDLVLEMLFDRVSRPDCAKGYLLDGFPRTIPQAEALDRFLKGTPVIALNLVVSDDVIVKRAEGRLTCKKCGHVFSSNLSQLKAGSACEKCGGELFQRPDDAPAVVKERLRVYSEHTKPLIQFYEKKGVLHQINGENSPDTVYQDLKRALKEPS